ncbi:MAG: hypothetical protein JNG84_02385 [Archangium sp.]|nr:hypothetical protein [Archangium sp.]
MKIRSAGTSGSSLLGGQSQAPIGRTHSHPMAAVLFGKRPPKLVDKRAFPKLSKGLRKLTDLKEHIATAMGRSAGTFSLELCEGQNACISREGQIAFGVELLAQFQGDDDLLLGVLGHEIGHQPWTWPNHDLSSLSRSMLDVMYREEEAKADRFAGRMLAELAGDPRPVQQFLLSNAKGFEQKQSPEYYPPGVRVDMIQGAYDRRRRMMGRSTTLLRGG